MLFLWSSSSSSLCCWILCFCSWSHFLSRFHFIFIWTRLHEHQKDLIRTSIDRCAHARESSMRKRTLVFICMFVLWWWSLVYARASYNCHWMETLQYANIPNRLACIMIVSIAIIEKKTRPFVNLYAQLTLCDRTYKSRTVSIPIFHIMHVHRMLFFASCFHFHAVRNTMFSTKCNVSLWEL